MSSTSTLTRPAAGSTGRRLELARPAAPRATAPALHVPLVVPARPEPAPRTHLTRRGRLAILLVVAALLFAAFSLGRAASQASTAVDAASDSVATAPVEQITVLPGDTLWSVAKRIAPDNDPREVVAQIRDINDLSTSELQVGQQLFLPTAG